MNPDPMQLKETAGDPPTPGYRLLYIVGKLLGVLLMALILFGFGVILGAGFSVGANLVEAAAPRPAQVPPGTLDPVATGPVLGRSTVNVGRGWLPTDAPPERTTAPQPTSVSNRLSNIGRHGTLSHMGASYPATYLAIPLGPGVTVKLCGVRCGTYVSTDAGPNRAMLVKGRIADASVDIFEHVCAAPASVGLCDARWTVVR